MTAGTLAKVAERLNRRHLRLHGGGLPALLMLTDEVRLPDPLGALDTLPPGSGVILRHYGLSPDERRALAIALRRGTMERGLLFLVAGDAALARTVRADGLHLPEWMVARRHRWARSVVGGLITAAAHSLPAMERAARAGVDAVLLSPVFATKSHPDARPIGPERAGLLLARSTMPAYALGGVTDRSAPRLLPYPFAGLAAVGAFGD